MNKYRSINMILRSSSVANDRLRDLFNETIYDRYYRLNYKSIIEGCIELVTGCKMSDLRDQLTEEQLEKIKFAAYIDKDARKINEAFAELVTYPEETADQSEFEPEFGIIDPRTPSSRKREL